MQMTEQINKISGQFPILSRKVHGKRLVYLDNAATTQKPQQVIDTLLSYYQETNANVHRCVHFLSEEATLKYEGARQKIATFLGASSSDEIIFTKGTTEGLNMIAKILEPHVNEGEDVMISAMEHHSNIIPWQQVCKRKKANLVVVDIDQDGLIDLNDFRAKISNKTKVVSFVHISHVLGSVNDVNELTKIAHERGAVVVIDGAQAIAHVPVDVSKMDCDFYVFSSHKMYGPTGVGVVYGKKDLLNKLDPCEFGGSMIDEVSFNKSTWAPLPQKFEAGTPHIAGVVGLGAAIDFLQSPEVVNAKKNEQEVLAYAYEKLKAIPEVTIIGPTDVEKRSVLIAFAVEGVHPHDVSHVLDQAGVAVRAGHHCAMPLHEKLGILATTRIALGVYNTKEDIDVMVEALQKAIVGLKK